MTVRYREIELRCERACLLARADFRRIVLYMFAERGYLAARHWLHKASPCGQLHEW